MAEQVTEKRGAERKSLRVLAFLVFPGMAPIPVRTIDISANGMCIVASANPPPNVQCGFQLNLPKKPSGAFALSGRVRVIDSVLARHDDGFRISLQFLNLSAQGAAEVAQYIKA